MAAIQQLLLAVGAAGSSHAAVANDASYDRNGSTPVGIRFQSNGQVWIKTNTTGGVYAFSYMWLTGSGAGADYEIRATLDGGSPDTVSSGTLGTWQALSSNREWTRASASWIERTATFIIEIRDAVSHIVLADATISLVCEYGTGTPP